MVERCSPPDLVGGRWVGEWVITTGEAAWNYATKLQNSLQPTSCPCAQANCAGKGGEVKGSRICRWHRGWKNLKISSRTSYPQHARLFPFKSTTTRKDWHLCIFLPLFPPSWLATKHFLLLFAKQRGATIRIGFPLALVLASRGLLSLSNGETSCWWFSFTLLKKQHSYPLCPPSPRVRV